MTPLKALHAVLLIVTTLAAACAGGRLDRAQLNEGNVAELCAAFFPHQGDADPSSYRSLVEDCRHFGIVTVSDLRKIILENRAFAESEEARSFARVKQSTESTTDRPNAVLSRGYFYNSVGMVRNALRGHVGNAAFSEYEARKAGPSPRPTTGSVSG